MLKCEKDGVMIMKPGHSEHQDELQHLPWPVQSPDLNIFKPLWAVLERRIRRFTPPTLIGKMF